MFLSCLPGGQAETDRTHTERETHPAGCQLPLPRPAGALLQGVRVDSYQTPSSFLLLFVCLFVFNPMVQSGLELRNPTKKNVLLCGGLSCGLENIQSVIQ